MLGPDQHHDLAVGAALARRKRDGEAKLGSGQVHEGPHRGIGDAGHEVAQLRLEGLAVVLAQEQHVEVGGLLCRHVHADGQAR
jgi:hypothetical protein